MSQRLVVVSPDGISPEGVDLLASDPRFQIEAKKLQGDALRAALRGADALIVRSATQVTQDLLRDAPKLKVVARAGVGVDNIDLDACTKKGVLVMNTPDGNTVSAAEHTLALLLACSRHLATADHHVREGGWDRKRFLGAELRGKTLGVVGLGKIGRRVAKYAAAMDMRVLAFDPVVTPAAAAAAGVELRPLDEVFAESDYLTLHVPKNEHTENLIGERSLGLMKRGVRIVNCARGGIVDEAALAAALKSGKVAAAALDVFAEEPLQKETPLKGAPNLTLTPHLGASTVEAQDLVGIEAARLVRDYLLQGSIKNAVNAPALDPADAEVLEPFCQLGRRLGSLQAQLLEGGLTRIGVTFAGPAFEGRDRTFLLRSVLEGFFRHYQSEPVNFVNVDRFAKEHQIALEERTTSETQGFVNLITVTLASEKGERSVSGSIFGRSSPRLVAIDRYRMDALPEGHAVLFANDDRPGMLGRLASALGDLGINIGNVSLGRDEPSGMALAFLNVDGAVGDEVAARLRGIPGIRWLRPLSF